MSARFIDGPLKGQALNLQRSPMFLRGTVRLGQRFDALDQLEDEPREDEALFAYELASAPSRGFVDSRSYSGLVVFAEYKLCDPQPLAAEMRDNARWAAWVDAEAARRWPGGKVAFE